MLIIEKIPPVQEQLTVWRNEEKKIALVPTMGNLHDGHLSLVKEAKRIADKVVVSIFVNPIQFVQGEDYGTYPRTPNEDRKKLDDLAVDLVFEPGVKEIYPDDAQQQTRIHVPGLDNILCGLSRPGHFSGVATVVVKLFNIVKPDVAIFGQKDFQQLLLIKKLVEDLFLSPEIIGMPTVREDDGLAMSSRNSYLTKEERKCAPILFQVLKQTADSILDGNADIAGLEAQGKSKLDNAGFKTEYFSIRDAGTLGEPSEKDMVIMAAAHLGKARLIDNVIIRR